MNINESKIEQNIELLSELDDRKALLRRVCLLRSNIEQEFEKAEMNSTTSLIYAVDNLQRLINSNDEPDQPKYRDSTFKLCEGFSR